ncbi:MAG TPA: UPF0182 family protein, partial [Candidatus Acidoferrales bacterium]|nr:UPF0182 family protein [Candidatus Acidoferrales bacterium]
VDWLWFDSLGLGAVFSTVWHTQVAAFAAAAALTAVVLAINGLLAVRMPVVRTGGLRLLRPNGGGEGPVFVELTPDVLPWRLIIPTAAVMLGVFVGMAQAGNWQIWQRWLNAVPFGRSDSLFANDLGFYVFAIPLFELARDWAFLVLFLSAVFAAAIYWARGGVQIDERGPRLGPSVIRHLSVLLALFFLIKAVDYWLQRYGLLYGSNGVVSGAAYTDVHLRLPLLTVLAALSLFAGMLCAANVGARGSRLPVAAVVLVFGASFLDGVVPSLFQSYRVKPDELRLEAPYIAQTIESTRYAFGLSNVTIKPFRAEGTLTPTVIGENSATIQNLRWWDPRPLLDSYRQLQEIRLYYDFKDIDVDRYTIDGRYQQVLLSARELNQSRLPADAQTWINQRFKFTHGYGVAMSPVNRFDEEGLPHFYIKDIPPLSSIASPETKIERPEIYFGEATRNYVVTGGGTTEFDYPKGQENVYTTYQGHDGVSLASLWRRALFAWHFGDLKLLISGNVTESSRILFRRLVHERINHVAPFLVLDRDPYLVIDGGRLLWVQDAYTTSDGVPYSQRTQGGINYIRNSVKIVVDAYDGTPTFYVADADDPIIRTYQNIFPTLFRSLDTMPASLRQHLRYPEDLFVVQASMYGTYHMTDPEVFYNKEDQWSFPQESYDGNAVTMQPYYTIMRLPDEKSEELVLMLPMVPNGRDNMIAWLAARCDGPHYGTLIEYAFPKERLIYGPAQIEARIDQDTTISQQLSLWNQTGSRVIRGNLLVIPIDDTLLYVEPLYLRAEKRELPELKRIIASAGDRVVMSQNVESLLAALVGAPSKPPATTASVQPAVPKPEATATTTALQHYQQALDALRRNDWRKFGVEMDALRDSLEANAGGGDSAPAAAPKTE